jgi:hypothetical protein
MWAEPKASKPLRQKFLNEILTLPQAVDLLCNVIQRCLELLQPVLRLYCACSGGPFHECRSLLGSTGLGRLHGNNKGRALNMR